MMEGIKLVRIDFRLIHGQVITKWSNKISATRIVVVNDALSKDEFMADIYVMAAPPGMTVDVISIDDFVANANGGEYDKGNVLVLFRGIEDCKSVVDKGIIFKQVQIGGLGSGNGRTSVVKGISIDETGSFINSRYWSRSNISGNTRREKIITGWCGEESEGITYVRC